MRKHFFFYFAFIFEQNKKSFFFKERQDMKSFFVALWADKLNICK